MEWLARPHCYPLTYFACGLLTMHGLQVDMQYRVSTVLVPCIRMSSSYEIRRNGDIVQQQLQQQV